MAEQTTNDAKNPIQNHAEIDPHKNKNDEKNLCKWFLITTCVMFVAVQISELIFMQRKASSLKDFKLPEHQIRTLEVSELYAAKYNDYLKRFGKYYDDDDEVLRRFQTFKNSLKEISQLNKLSGAKYDLTKFSDVSMDELIVGGYHDEYNCRKQNKSCLEGIPVIPIDFENLSIPDRFDWRDYNKVGPVLNQKKCNGCWAFGVVGAMESMSARRLGGFGPSLSVQELIDCTNDTAGCAFGHVHKALDFLCDDHWGLVPEEYYPLKLFQQKCQYTNPWPPPGLRLRNYWYLCNKTGEEEDLLRLVRYHGPLIVVVNANPWRNYIDGVIQRGCSRGTNSYDHVVQIVGYDRSPEDGVTPPHYIVKNSWGSDFGDGGYVKLALGGNICGVAEEVVLVDVY